MSENAQIPNVQDHTDAPVPMTDEQKFFFDLRGWILLPSVLSASEIEEMKAEVYAGVRSFEGKLQMLLDHPAVVGILSEVLSEDPFVKEDCYSFRCEGFFNAVRHPGWSKSERKRQRTSPCRPPATTSQRHALSSCGQQDLRGIDSRRLGARGSKKPARVAQPFSAAHTKRISITVGRIAIDPTSANPRGKRAWSP